MADWDEIKSQIGKAANKAVKKTGEIADIASKQIKLKTYDAKLSSKYESLGRLTYKQIKCGESQAERISNVITEIDDLRVKRSQLADEIEADKVRRAEERAEAKRLAEQQMADKGKAAAEAAQDTDKT